MNEVIVTRAPRPNLVPTDSVPNGKYILARGGSIARMDDRYIRFLSIDVRRSMWDADGNWFVFYDFEAMCKWVANGRKLEDLQADVRAEYVRAVDAKLGSYFTLDDEVFFLTLNGDLVSMSGDCRKTMLYSTLVWPVRFDLGDTITIKGGGNG